MSTKGNLNQKRTVRFAAATVMVAVALTLIAALVPTGVTAEAATDALVFRSRLTADATVGKLAVASEPGLPMSFATRARTATIIQPVAAPKPAVKRTTTSSASVGTGSTGSSTGTVATTGGDDETAAAQVILAGYIAQYPILAGTTVTFGDAHGTQAIAYYKSGRIVISPTHTASLQRIIGHEIWHIIDWRDNGTIDWGENVPPQ